MEDVTITIIKWDDFNGKETEKTPNWCKIHINIGSSRSLFGLNFTQKWLWICVLCEAKRAKCKTFKLNLAYAAQHWGFTQNQLIQSLNALKNVGILRLNSELAPRRLEKNSTLEREEEREEEREREREDFDFESIYKDFPRKEGKSRGISACETQIKTKDDFLALIKAVQKYKDLCESERREKKHIKMFSSFMNELVWRDYIDEDVGTSSIQLKENNVYSLLPGETA